MQRGFGYDVHVPAQKVFEVLLEGNAIEQAPALLHGYQDVHVLFHLRGEINRPPQSQRCDPAGRQGGP